ncbi:MAG TPA: S53 family peptidase [Mycobacteriales bacterium]|nr:S53 family peptidase [Mycobacteriales bacterium]
MAMTRFRLLAIAGSALALATTVPSLASSAGTASWSLPSVVPAFAHGVPAAAEPASAPVHVALLLRGRDSAGLASFAREVSTPGSPSYRQFLTHAELRARHAPSVLAVTAVTAWLRAAGLTVDSVSPDRDLVAAHGPAASVGSAFGTSFARFDVGGRLLRAPLKEVHLPAVVAPYVAAVTGLTERYMSRPSAAPPAVFLNARPCSAYYAQKTATSAPTYNGRHQPYAICGYTPAQIRGAYGVGATHLTGKGVTVAIVDAFASGTIEADVNTWSKRHGLPALKAGQLTQANPGLENIPEDPLGTGLLDPQGWSGEETLDVEAVHAMAPAAGIYYVGAVSPLNATLLVAEAQAIEDGTAQVVSNSWGSSADSPDPADKAIFDQLTSDAAATGVTVAFSTGDDGDQTSSGGQRTADFPATSDMVVAVGGTTLKVLKGNRYGGETYWGTKKTPLAGKHWDFAHTVFNGGAGGGVSTSYPEPAWQKRVVPATYASMGVSTPGRVLPDLSLDADSTTGFLIGQTQTRKDGSTAYSEFRIGGTSLSCPLFAGLMALADQSAGRGLGLVTPTLYAVAARGRIATVFRDPAGVTMGRQGLSTLANVRPDYTDTTDPTSQTTFSLRTLGTLYTLHHRKGYDDSTGLGSPKAPAFVAAVR